ncbi:MAG: GAF domain-containing protein [Bacteroidota bacterium]
MDALLDGEADWTAAMATVVCELHHAFEHYHWTGFYRAVSDDLLIVGPYQGGHGCLRIPFDRGVCGAAARTRTTQLVPDVEAFPGHIACSSTTRSEVVVPVLTPDGTLLAVLDVDSDDPDAFTAAEDQAALEALCARLGAQFAHTTQR